MIQKHILLAALALAALPLTGCSDLVDKVEPATAFQPPASLPAASINNPPSISGSPSTNAIVGMPWAFAPSVSDPDGDAVIFSIENQPMWTSFASSTGRLSGIPQLGQQGDYPDIRISVNDGQIATALPEFTITVLSTTTNSAPLISGTPPGNVLVGQPFSFRPNASDPDGDALTFFVTNRPDWATFNFSTGEIRGTPDVTDVGLFSSIVISVSDGQQSTSLPEFAVSVQNPAGPNTVPQITGTAATAATVGQLYAFQPSASDADGDNLVFAIANLPNWASFSNTSGMLSGTPGIGNAGTYQNIVISVSDGTDTAALPGFAITVAAANGNGAPIISGNPAVLATVDQAYAFQPSASDPDGDNLTFAIANLPSWAFFSTASGMLAGTPADGDVRTYQNIVISVSDGQLAATLPAFSIVVDNPNANAAPQISGNASTTATVDQAYAFQPSASDADGDNLTFAIANQPGWAFFNTTSGMLAGTPTDGDEATYQNIVISVSDGTDTAALPGFAITVAAADINEAPIISGSPSTTATVDQAYAFQPSASDPDGDNLTFAIANQPGWAFFNTTSGMLAGTPADGDEDTYQNIVISVSDGTDTAALPGFAITVAAADVNEAPIISGSPPTTATVDQPYAFQPGASDPDGDTLTFSIANLPGWASFSDTTGLLNGTPAQSDEGIHGNITISVNDGTETAALPGFAITVAAADVNEAPIISGSPSTTATVDQPYAFQPSASDPDGDTLTFSIASQPGWASFSTASGVLSGTPAEGDERTYQNIVISVSDGDMSASLPSFPITVSQVATGSATLRWTAPTRNTDGSLLTDLTAYIFYYGNSPGYYPNEIRVDNPGITSYVIENLTANSYYFVVTSVNSAEVESVVSNEASITIN